MSTSTTRACPKCSTAISPTSKFCPSCGTSVSGVFSGGGTPLDGTAVLGAESVDTVLPILQDATLGYYDIYGLLGRGGMAAVYLALDLKLNRKVAIKTMLPELVTKKDMVERFKREARTSAALSHPHIIQIFAVEETDELVYFVMKYIEGRSLESVILERGKLDVDLTRVVVSQAGAALAFAHRKNVIHRDVKPANIMLEEDGWAIVTDFGIAKVQEAQNLTATGTAIGTPHYMSPEQFHNKAVTGASDQYSLGIVAYEMLTGRKPFDGATYAEIITQHLFETPTDLRELRPDVPLNVAETITRMLSKDAAARFPDLDAAVSALGMPSKTQGEVARTQMISLAKSGPEKKIRMSVPISPVPQTRAKPRLTKVDQNASATIVEQKQPEKKSSKMGLIAAVVVLVLVAVGGTAAFMMKGRSIPQAQTASAPASAGTPVSGAATPAGTVQSGQQVAANGVNGAAAAPPAANPPAAEEKPADAPKPLTAKEKAKARADSLKIAKAAKDQLLKEQSVTAAKVASANAAAAKTADAAKTTVANPPVTPKPVEAAPAPAAITGSIKIVSHTDGAMLYINGVLAGPLKGIVTKDVTARPNGTAQIKVAAGDKCTPWDTTVTIAPGPTLVVGRHDLTCQ